ncbi:hypothetical protein WJX72_005735 [[Myrmecia] bisecta]|uniref:Glycine-rich protein n=1 Tax=[Myrmecia] bisecta TaxID=41462 RepID=A0AAW1R7N8_9CHLO
MVYIVNGQVVQKRSPWRLSIIPDTFWAIVNAIAFFFTTLFNPQASDDYKSHGRKKGWGSGGGPGGGPGKPGGGGGGGPRGPRITGMSNLQSATNGPGPCGGGG